MRGMEELGESRYCVLAALSDGPMTVSGLAAHERVSTPSMSKLVTSMTHSGLVQRVRDESDGRRVDVSLTEGGRQALSDASAAGAIWMNDYFKDLKEEDVSLLARAAELMRGMSTR